MLRRKKNQSGFVYSLECCLILMFVFCSAILCWATIGSKILGEYGDIGDAIGSLNQSYTLTGIAVGHPNDPVHPTNIAEWVGSSFVDGPDFCDSGNCGIQVCLPPGPPG